MGETFSPLDLRDRVEILLLIKQLVKQGETSIEELIRVTAGEH